jgi:hypothetical protein
LMQPLLQSSASLQKLWEQNIWNNNKWSLNWKQKNI